MIVTGVEKLDEYLGGGITLGSIALLNSDPGIDLVEFQLHLLRSQENLNTLYVVNNKKPDVVQFTFSKMGVENVHILDSFSGLMCVSEGYESVNNPDNPDELYDKIRSLVEKYEFNVIVFDSLTMLHDQIGSETIT